MKLSRLTSAALAAALASTALAGCAVAQSAPPVATPTPPQQSLADLVAQVDIPYQQFTLPNGLTTLVHTDRKSPLVGVTVYYRVGSKNEPRGRTGFAHLFEHIMFTGSENVENFDIPLEGAGSTPTNGSTWYDRTNYVETVPTGALDRTLMMEADRMGYLLGAVSQERLDRQRGVVQNEKRQGDNQPFGLAEYLLSDRLLPIGHPYRHSTIGSMADLDAASLGDVADWFRANYGPNNVVLVLAGDIDAATARPLVERWFGAIPRGPDVPRVEAGPVTLAAPIDEEITDQVSQTRISRNWTGPGVNDPDAIPLQVGLYILGGLASSRLDNAMVYGPQVATRVGGNAQVHEQLSFLTADFDLAPDADRATAQALFDGEIARMISEGPTADEVQRAATQLIAGQLGSLEHVGGFGGKGMVLAEGQLFSNDPAKYRADLLRVASLTPAEIRDAMARWMSRPAYTLAVVPGERTLDGATMGGWGDEAEQAPPAPDAGGGATAPRTGPARTIPDAGPVPVLTFPTAERAQLGNRITVNLVRRTSVPTVTVALTLDAGSAADSPDEAGRHELMVDMLSEGTQTRDAMQIVREQEALGAAIAANAGVDSTTVVLNALTSNLPQSLGLMADITLNPAFRQEDFDRVQAQRLAEIDEEQTTPGALAGRAMGRVLYGDAHPYALANTIGSEAVVARLTPADMRAEHSEWFRPDLAQITVVGDVDMASLLPLLEDTFGQWGLRNSGAPGKAIDAPAPAPRARLVVVDRPNSPQSVVVVGHLLPVTGTQGGQEPLELANEVIGNGFLSRLNNDLRETRGWTYGVRSAVSQRVGQPAFTVSTSVQADRTGDSIKVILDQLAAFPAARPVDEVELQRVTDGNIRGLPNRFETNGQVIGALLTNQLLGRPDDYQARLPAIYGAIDAMQIDAAARSYMRPDDMAIVVVGDRAVIEPQLAQLGLPVEYMAADGL